MYRIVSTYIYFIWIKYIYIYIYILYIPCVRRTFLLWRAKPSLLERLAHEGLLCTQSFANDREPFYNEETGAFPLTSAVANMYLLT